MQISVRVIVKDVRLIDRTKDGQPIRQPFQVLTAFDRDTAGEIQLTFPNRDCPYIPTQEVQIDGVIKGRMRGYQVVFDVVSLVAVKK